jgi:hypothetical protein
MPTVIIPDKICPHCGGNKWFFRITTKKDKKYNSYECYIKSYERKKKWQQDNIVKYLEAHRKRRKEFRELNPLVPRSKMSKEEIRIKNLNYQKEKYKSNPKFKEQVKERAKKYELSLTTEQRKLRYRKNYYKDIEKSRERHRLCALKIRENLNESYVKFLIIQFTGLSVKDLPQELIELKRKQLLLTRQIKNHESKKENINN